MKKLTTIETLTIGAGAIDLLGWVAIGALGIWNLSQQQQIHSLHSQTYTLNDKVTALQDLNISTSTLVLLHEEQLSHLPGFDEATQAVFGV